MKKNSSEKENNKPGAAGLAMKGAGNYMRKNYPFLILFFAEHILDGIWREQPESASNNASDYDDGNKDSGNCFLDG